MKNKSHKSICNLILKRDSRILLALALTFAFLLCSWSGAAQIVSPEARRYKIPRAGNVNYDSAKALAVQPDGKIIVAGMTRGKGINRGTASKDSQEDFALARYSADGSLDASFGDGGRVVTDFAGNRDNVRAIALQPDGKILLVGTTDWDYCDSDFALARYNSDGTPDTSFGQSGKVVTDFLGRDRAFAVAIQGDGRILVTGVAFDKRLHVVVARYTHRGKLDATFGTDGKVVTPSNHFTDACSISIRPGGVISVAGGSSICYADGRSDISITYETSFALARFRSDGQPDTTLAGTGTAFTFWRNVDVIATAIAIQPDGKSIMAGNTGFEGKPGFFALQRFNVDGKLDDSFGDKGKIITTFEHWTQTRAIGLLTDGSFVVAGSARGYKSFTLARYSKDGKLDLDFGRVGRVITPFDAYVEALAVAVQPDGKIIASGYMETGDLGDFLLMRYDKAGTLDSAFGIDGRVYSDFNGVTDKAPSTNLKPSRKPTTAQRQACIEGPKISIEVVQVDPRLQPKRDDLIPTDLPTGIEGPPSPDPGTGGGMGSGSATGLGPGRGANPGSGAASVSGNINPDGSAKSVDAKPVKLNDVEPLYTEEARKNKIQGTVRVRIMVGADGRVKRASIVTGLPDGLNEMALQAAHRMQYKPAIKDGQPVAYWLNNVLIEFKMR
jgi:TonB family protein